MSVNATSTDAIADLSSIMTITPSSSNDEMYFSSSVTVTVVASTTTALSASVDVADPTEFEVTMTITVSLQSSVAIYLAPSAHYRLVDPMDSAMANSLMTQYLSPESMIAGYTVPEALELTVSGLLRGVAYNYSILVLGPNGEEANMTGYFTTSMGDISRVAASYNLTLVGNYTADELVEPVCELPEWYAIPEEDISTLAGVTCYTPINYADEAIYTGGAGTTTGGSSDSVSSSSSSARMLQSLSSSSSSSSSDAVDLTIRSTAQYIVLYPIRSWVADYTLDPIDSLTMTEELIIYYEDYEVDEVVYVETIDIVEVASTTVGTPSPSTDSVTVSGISVHDAAANSVAGSLCYAIFLGSIEVTSSMIAGNTDTIPLENGCMYLEGGEVTGEYSFLGLSPSTAYTVGYYGKSIDPREYAQGTAAVGVSVTTNSIVVDEPEEEEYGLISSLGFVALLLAALFHF